MPGDSSSININSKGSKQNTFDAIVIGSGISGWDAKEICEHGLKTLFLERGRNVEHIKDYPTAILPVWTFTRWVAAEWVKMLKHHYLTIITSCIIVKTCLLRWRMCGKHRQSKSFSFVYGFNCKSCKLCCG